MQEENFYKEVKKNLSEHLADDDDIIEVEEEFGDENSDISDNESEDSMNNNNDRIDEYLNLASEELQWLLEIQVVKVRIKKQLVDYEEKVFDINVLLQKKFGDQN